MSMIQLYEFKIKAKIVLMDRDDHIQKVERTLNDGSFNKLPKDPQ